MSETPTFTFTADEHGYKIYRDGVLFIDQPHKPGTLGFQPFADAAEATTAAEAHVARLEADAARERVPFDQLPDEIRQRLLQRGYR